MLLGRTNHLELGSGVKRAIASGWSRPVRRTMYVLWVGLWVCTLGFEAASLTRFDYFAKRWRTAAPPLTRSSVVEGSSAASRKARQQIRRPGSTPPRLKHLRCPT